MPAPRLLMRKIREILRLKHEQGLSHRAIAQACSIGVGTVTLYLQRLARLGMGWPLPAELDDAALEARLFSRPAPAPRPRRARLRVSPPRAQAGRRHAAAALGGVRPGPSERLPAHAVLRDLPAVGAAAAAVDAARPPGWGEDVHRLLRQAADAGRRPNGRSAARRAVRRRARRQQPHVRRGDRDAAAARLGRRPRPDGRVLRGHDHSLGPRPAQERRHASLPLRAGRQSDLRGPRRPLRRRRDARAAEEASRQGRRGGQCARGPTMGPRATPPPDLLQPRGAQRGDPRAARRAQRPADEEARRQPPHPLRAARPARAATPAGRPLRPGPLEAVPRQHRLPRPRRAPRLQRALPAPPRAGRGSATPRRPSRSSARAGG